MVEAPVPGSRGEAAPDEFPAAPPLCNMAALPAVAGVCEAPVWFETPCPATLADDLAVAPVGLPIALVAAFGASPREEIVGFVFAASFDRLEVMFVVVLIVDFVVETDKFGAVTETVGTCVFGVGLATTIGADFRTFTIGALTTGFGTFTTGFGTQTARGTFTTGFGTVTVGRGTLTVTVGRGGSTTAEADEIVAAAMVAVPNKTAALPAIRMMNLNRPSIRKSQ